MLTKLLYCFQKVLRFGLFTVSKNQFWKCKSWIFTNCLTNQNTFDKKKTINNGEKLGKIQIHSFRIGCWILWASYLLFFLPMFPGSSSSFAIWCIFLCLALIRPKNFRNKKCQQFYDKEKKILINTFGQTLFGCHTAYMIIKSKGCWQKGNGPWRKINIFLYIFFNLAKS